MISSTYAKSCDTNAAEYLDSTWKKQLGDFGESAACEFLQGKGWAIVERNFRAGKIGEIDIIALTAESQLVAVEVKTRCRNPQYELDWQSTGFAAIDARKQKKLKAMAAIYANFRRPQHKGSLRIDCILVDLPLSNKTFRSLLKAGQLEEVSRPHFVHVENAIGQF